MTSEQVLSTKFNTAIALEIVEFIKDFDSNRPSRRYRDDVNVISTQFSRFLDLLDSENEKIELQYIENNKLQFFTMAESREIMQILQKEIIKRKNEFDRVWP